MSTFVSKNARSPVIRFQPVELETTRQRTLQATYPLDGLFCAAVASDLKLASSGNPDLDLVSLCETKRLDDAGRKANRQAVSPLCNSHRYTCQLYIKQARGRARVCPSARYNDHSMNLFTLPPQIVEVVL